MPLSLGEISQGSYADFTLKYFVPSGVTSFKATVYSTCKDTGGEAHYYPEKRDFYSYNEANQLVELYDGDGETTAFAYNSGGALAQETKGAETTSYSYDGMDKLSQVQTPASTVDYAYDALGRRISRSEGTDTVNYHLYGKTDLVDYRTDETGTLTASTLRGAGGLISETDHTTPTPETDYYLFNPHGDTAAITDEAGTVTSTYRYDAFGNELNQNTPAYGYTGKWQRETDTTTGAIQMGARDYDPGLGRFTSADPLKGSPLNPQQRNRYPYTGNNPLTRYDLNGLYWGESYVNWIDDKISGAREWVHRPENCIFTGTCLFDDPIVQVDNEALDFVMYDPMVNLAFATSLSGFGSAAYSPEMESFYGVSRGARLAAERGRGATCTANGGWAAGIKSELSGLRSGSGSRIKLVDSTDELEVLFSRLSGGGSPVAGTSYPGQLVALPDETTVGLRNYSASGGPTIDITLPNGTRYKVHVQP